MKDCTTCKYGFVDERLGFPMCHHPKRFSEDCVDFNMHEEIEEPKKATGIEEKKLPDGLDEAAEESWAEYEYREHPQGLYASCYQDGFKAGAEWIAGQGVSGKIVMTYSDGTALIECPHEGEIGDKVIIQIRKK